MYSMDSDIKKIIKVALSSVPLALGVVAAVLALMGTADMYTIMALLGIGLFTGAISDLVY